VSDRLVEGNAASHLLDRVGDKRVEWS